ncbi:MAG: sulfite exporter TauE/SafE family protein [Deltaproteobacteria bacterium]|nr:sulfite exporter TauE/SafE family protein [Deltaproteobacteria bacterium]
MEYIYFIGLGCITGLMSGTLGIGGGVVIVPGLIYIYTHLGIADNLYMHVASGTSLAVMIFTSTSNTISCQRQKRIDWRLFRLMVPWIIVFDVVGAVMASFMRARWLETIFAGVILVMAAMMIFDLFKKNRSDAAEVSSKAKPISLLPRAVVGIVIGLKSGLLGIGGGAIATPFFSTYGIPIRIATGTTASLTLPIGIVGTMSFVLIGIISGCNVNNTIGFVHWPSVIILAPFSMATAALGTKLANRMPTLWLKSLFIAFLLCTGVEQLIG